MHFTVTGIHIGNVFLFYFIQNNKVLQMLVYNYMCNCWFRYDGKSFKLCSYTFCRKSKTVCCFNHPQYVSSLLVCKGILADAGNGELKSIMCTYRGKTCSTAVSNVMLFNFDSFSIHNSFILSSQSIQFSYHRFILILLRIYPSVHLLIKQVEQRPSCYHKMCIYRHSFFQLSYSSAL